MTIKTLTSTPEQKLEQRRALALAVADAMGSGWNQVANAMRDAAIYVGRGDMTFRIGFSGDAGHAHRLHISAWSWPSYMERAQSHCGQPATRSRKILSPSSLYPKQDVASITVSAEKSADIIAQDIRRRFLAEYTRLYELCAIEAARWQKIEDDAMSDWAAVCKVLGPSASDQGNTQYADVNGNGKNYGFRIENRNGKAHVEVDLTAEQLRKVLDVLKG